MYIYYGIFSLKECRLERFDLSTTTCNDWLWNFIQMSLLRTICTLLLMALSCLAWVQTLNILIVVEFADRKMVVLRNWWRR